MKRTAFKNRGKGLERGKSVLKRGRMKVRRYSKEPTVDGATLRNVRDECDALVRVIIALRDEQCVTCPQREDLEVGHLFKRGKEHVRWNLFNVAGQCPSCNFLHNDHPQFYIARFVVKHGEAKYAELWELSRDQRKLTYVEMLAIRDELRREAAKVAV